MRLWTALSEGHQCRFVSQTVSLKIVIGKRKVIYKGQNHVIDSSNTKNFRHLHDVLILLKQHGFLFQKHVPVESRGSFQTNPKHNGTLHFEKHSTSRSQRSLVLSLLNFFLLKSEIKSPCFLNISSNSYATS